MSISTATVGACPVGAKLLGGGCSGSNSAGFTIIGAEPRGSADQQSFGCEWRSTRNVDEMATATAICLVPAP